MCVWSAIERAIPSFKPVVLLTPALIVKLIVSSTLSIATTLLLGSINSLVVSRVSVVVMVIYLNPTLVSSGLYSFESVVTSITVTILYETVLSIDDASSNVIVLLVVSIEATLLTILSLLVVSVYFI